MVMETNALTGKMNRGLSVLETANILSKDTLSKEESKPYIALGWCIEFVPYCQHVYND